MNGKYQVMPPLSDEEYQALKASIAKAGRAYYPIIKDDEGNIIDGHHRARALEELGLTMSTKTGEWHLRGYDASEARMFARRLNLGRRHLTREQIAQIVLDVKAEHPRWSAAKISAELGGMPSRMTVETILRDRVPSQSGKVRTPQAVEGRDGKDYPASLDAAAEQRAQIASAIALQPRRSNREIAAEIGCSDRTVVRVRKGTAAPTTNGSGQPQAPEKPVSKPARVTAPADPKPDPADRRDAVAFAKDLEATLGRALARRPEAFIDLLPSKRQADIIHILNRFCVWATIATGEQQS